MIKGLEAFKKHFGEFTDRYVVIGGVAASLTMEDAGLDFRGTKDFDLVLVVEAMDAEFVQQFWKFVQAGGYQVRERSNGTPEFYRFQKPVNPEYPDMLELFSRVPNGLNLAEGSHLTPIPIDEAVSSLSAILLDEEYYAFILAGTNVAEGIAWVREDRLIPLKANAWLDMTQRVADGEKIDSRKIRKHINDVLQLSQLFTEDTRIELPQQVADDLNSFLDSIMKETVDLKHLGLLRTDLPTIANRIRGAYGLIEADDVLVSN